MTIFQYEIGFAVRSSRCGLPGAVFPDTFSGAISRSGFLGAVSPNGLPGAVSRSCLPGALFPERFSERSSWIGPLGSVPSMCGREGCFVGALPSVCTSPVHSSPLAGALIIRYARRLISHHAGLSICGEFRWPKKNWKVTERPKSGIEHELLFRV